MERTTLGRGVTADYIPVAGSQIDLVGPIRQEDGRNIRAIGSKSMRMLFSLQGNPMVPVI